MRFTRRTVVPLAVLALALGIAGTACGHAPRRTAAAAGPSPVPSTASAAPSAAASTASSAPPAAPQPATGNPNGHAAVPPEAAAVDTSHPTRMIGDGTPASCTSAAV